MRTAVLLLAAIAIPACKPGGISKDQELCAKAAAMFAQCENTGDADKLQREIIFDRWRGLCRAVFTGENDQMFPETRDLFLAMDDDTKSQLREQAECTAKATTCAAYDACSR